MLPSAFFSAFNAFKFPTLSHALISSSYDATTESIEDEMIPEFPAAKTFKILSFFDKEIKS